MSEEPEVEVEIILGESVRSSSSEHNDEEKHSPQSPEENTTVAYKAAPSIPTQDNSSAFTVAMIIIGALVALFATEYASGTGNDGVSTNDTDSGPNVPAQSVFIDPRSFAVLGVNGTFRNSSQLFNPTSDTPPFIQIFSEEFLDVLGSSPSLKLIAQNESFAFAHEAPIWVPASDEVFFASNDGGAKGMSDLTHDSQYSRISLQNVDNLKPGELLNYTAVPLPEAIQMVNGGTPHDGELMIVSSGRGDIAPAVSRVNPSPPFNATVVLDNFFGRQFNSLNDVKVHPTSGILFFTDSSYGYLNHFRPLPQLPNQVYRLDLKTGQLRVAVDGFLRSNGIAFSGDGKTAFVTDTGATGGFQGNVFTGAGDGNVNQTKPATVYAFDVDPVSQAFSNRRVFCFVDNGIPDGIQVDTEGRVYTGTGDGVQVFNPSGQLIGKFFLGTTSANMAFAGPGRLIIMAETAIYMAKIAANGLPLEDF